MVYTAGRQSLAVLEALVQDQPLRARYLMIPAILPKSLNIERVAAERLPANWRSLATREELQAIGGEWAKARSSAVLAVPSAVIPAETNYLLNPLHPQFGRIEIGDTQELVTDVRLLGR